MSIRDELPGYKGKRKDAPPPLNFYKAYNCELRGCACGNRGKPDIAIHDQNKQPIGYVCQKGYMSHIEARGLDQFSQFKETGSPINRSTQAAIEAKGFQRFTDIVTALDGDFERYIESVNHERENDDAF